MKLHALITICVPFVLLVASCGRSDQAALRKAVQTGDTNSLALFLKTKTNANMLVRYSTQPGAFAGLLHIAVEAGQVETAKLLLDSGADPNQRDWRGRAPLIWTVEFTEESVGAEKRSELLKLLASAGAQLDLADSYGETALTYAAIVGNAQLTKQLVVLGAAVNVRNRYGSSPLHLAKTPAVAEVLLDAGADQNSTNLSGRTPLDVQLAEGRLNVVATLTNKSRVRP